MKRPTFSVVIPSHNEGALLRSTVAAVDRSSDDVEIVVVDDGSTDSSCDIDPTFSRAPVRVVRQPRAGVAAARHRGALEANGEFVAFLDAHCSPTPNWLAQLTSACDAQTAIVAPCIVDAAAPALKGFGVTLTDRAFRYRWLARAGVLPYEIPLAAGGCTLMRKSVYEELGGFDAMRTFGLEDVEMSLRSWLFGWTVKVEPTVEVTHLFRHTTPYAVANVDLVYNGLRTAVLHFAGPCLDRIVGELSQRPRFDEAARLLLVSDIWERRRFVDDRRRRSADWWAERFAIEL